MELIKVADALVAVNKEGFLLNLAEWNETVALTLAALESVEMSEAHWEIILFIRAYYQSFKHLPNLRVFTKALAQKLGSHKGNSRYLHNLFPQSPLRIICKIAGLPKPPSCL